MPYLSTIEQITDVLTKGLPKWQFNNLVDKLAMDDIFKLAFEGLIQDLLSIPAQHRE